MKNIKHSRIIDNSTNVIADEITKRAKRQSRRYAILFALLAVVILLYLVYSFSVNRYDGFLVSRNASVRHVDNIVVVDYWVKPGDMVKEGDTLYSYINIDFVNKVNNPYTVLETDNREFQATYRRDKLRSEYIEQKRSLDSLEQILKRTQNDITLGVATRDFLEQKQWEKVQAYEKMKHTERMIYQEQSIINRSGSNIDVGNKLEGLGSFSHSTRRENYKMFGEAYRYIVAYVDMQIVDIHARPGVVVLGGEEILTNNPYNSPEMLDMHVKMLLTPRQFSDIKNDMKFSVYTGDEYVGTVHVTYTSTYINDNTQEKGPEYEYKYNNREVIVRAEFEDKSTVREKFRVDKFPVTLRRYKWAFMEDMKYVL